MDLSFRLSGGFYWLVVAVVFGLGLIAVVTMGFIPLLLLAVALVVLSPLRARPRSFWTGLALVVGFLAAFVLVAPWSCPFPGSWYGFSPRPSRDPVLRLLMCDSLIGYTYMAGPNPVWPPIVAGVIGALGGAVLVRKFYRPVRSA